MQIVTVTLNPCIDKSTAIAALLPEKKLRCTKPVLEPGGGGINVARAIKKLGGEAVAMYLAGGYNGNLISQLLAAEDVAGLPIVIKNDTRENIVVLDAAANQQYRFCMPGPEVADEELNLCMQTLSKVDHIEYIVVSGSLPPGVPPDFVGQLARYAKKHSIKMVVDTAGESLQKALDAGVYLIKPNMAELCEYAGKSSLTMDVATTFCREIISNGQCEIVLLSMGGAGALLVTENITSHITPPPVLRQSTVGAGDSMTAGMVLSLEKGWDVVSAAQYGVASGTAATMRPGTQLCDVKDVELLYAKIKEAMRLPVPLAVDINQF